MAASAAASRRRTRHLTEPFDPFEFLRELDPVDRDALRGTASSPQARAALERILAERSAPASDGRVDVRFRGIHRKRRYVAVLLALTVSAVATAWAITRAPSERLTVGCYERPDVQAHTVVVAHGNVSPIETCRRVWLQGDFGTRVAPKLQACILTSGAIGVFPSPDDRVCRRLKLAPLVPVSPTSSGRPRRRASVTELKDALVHVFLANRCLSAQHARTAVRGELRRLPLARWKVESNAAFKSTRSCASFAFDEVRHLVLIVPIPKRP
jgi:hypothetical protein